MIATPIQVSPDWVQEHARIAAWALGTFAATLLALGGYFAKELFAAINEALADIKLIKNISTIQAENHLATIQTATLETRDATLQTNAKLDVLISVIERKL